MSIIISELEYLQIFGIALILIISTVLLRQKFRNSLNEPPLVPYKYPIIGHTIDYYKDLPEFLKKCHEEYGEIFSLYIWGSVHTFVGKELCSEVFKSHQIFDFNEAVKDTLPLGNFLNRPKDFFISTGHFVKESLHDLNIFAEKLQKSIINSIDDLIGDGKEIQSPLEVITKIVSRALAVIVLGEKLCKDEDVLHIFANITIDIASLLSVPPVLNFIYPGLHQKFIVFKFRFFDNPMKEHQKILISKITPVINQRINDKNNLGNSWKRPDDILQALMEKFAIDKDHVDIGSVADFIMSILIASIHTSSTTLLQCLFEYVNHPECHKELLEEAENIFYDKNKNIPYYTHVEISKMEKLDNFIKETLRTTRGVASLPRKTISQYTFSNGYQIPEDRMVLTILQHILFDQKAYGQDPKKFNPSHHVNSPAYRPERNFLAFGMGRFVCPGRFFAINEIKRILHFILLKYNIKSISGKHIESIRIGRFVLPSNEGLIFEKKER
ncbi:cytochrome P450 [Glomus cerebriforme]|uniref:Cytochrome P450 n=1 Tax=Glomus cerebriforme TaxID=658196 RepID=A0A397SU02_9GLOM|nr:cytochrome P450 [Glomus cerebriforme]